MRYLFFLVFLVLVIDLKADGKWQDLKGDEKIETAIAELSALENSDLNKAQVFVQKFLYQAATQHDSVSMAWAYSNLAKLSRFLSNYKAAENYVDKGIGLARKYDLSRLSDYLNEAGSIYGEQGKLVEALSYYYEAIEIAENSNNQTQLANGYYRIGFLFNVREEYDTAMNYFKKSLEINEELKDTTGIATSYNGIGLVELRKLNYPKAVNYFSDAIKMIENKDNPRLLAILYNNIGIAYEDQNMLEAGREYYFKSLEIKIAGNNKRGIASTYGNLADNFRQAKNFDKALEYTELGLQLAIATKALDYIATSYRRYWLCYKETGEFEEALYYLELYRKIEDSIKNEKSTQQINELKTLYEVAKKEKVNAELRTEVELRNYDLFKQKILSFGMIIVLTIALIALYVRHKISQKYKTLSDSLQEQTTQLQATNQKLKTVLYENKMMTNIIVHDIKAPLDKSLAINDLIQTSGSLNEEQKQLLSLLKNQLNFGRKVIGDLLFLEGRNETENEVIELNSFIKEELNAFTEQARKKEIDINIFNASKDIYTFVDKKSLKRIIDNLISNAIKFSPRQKKIEVKVHAQSKFGVVYIRDEGPGFTEEDKKYMFQKFSKLSAGPTGNESSSGLGLAIVKKLVDQIGGKIALLEEKEKGAVFELKLPLIEKKE